MTRRRLTIADIADEAIITKLWKRGLRSKLRAMRLPEFELAHDPLEHLAFDWELGETITTLCRDLKSGEYRAGKPEIVRAAKGLGLTRPLAFLKPRDLIVYKAVVSRAENSLLSTSKPWTRFGRADSGEDGDDSPAESGWFRGWLRRQGQLWTITENHQWLVETDIANFYGYLDAPAMISHVLANSDLDHDVARLLEHMLRQFSPMDVYRTSPLVGLPQENFDCSRILAHTFLKPVDEAFEAEGQSNQYSRWMDDIVIGADSYEEALEKVSRAQGAIERMGLYPNTAKTKIMRSQDFMIQYLKTENDFLGEVEERAKVGQAEDMALFTERLEKHLRLKDPKPKAWTRVLRRYYTASRQLRDQTLLRYAFEHLLATPESARHILEYLSTFRLTMARFARLRGALSQLRSIYEDVEILAYEYLCTAPNVASDHLRDELGSWALEAIARNRERNPRLAAAACLVVGKFGTGAHLADLTVQFKASEWPDTVARRQATSVLLGAGNITSGEVAKVSLGGGAESTDQARFLSAVVAGEEKAVNMVLSLVEPLNRTRPARFVVRPRCLPMVPLVSASAPAKLQALRPRWRRNLKSNSMQLRDFAAERLLGV